MRIETIEESSIGWVASAEHGGRKLEIHVFGHPPSSISLELFESDRRLTRRIPIGVIHCSGQICGISDRCPW